MGTHYQGSGESVRALDAYIKLVRAAESVTVNIHKVFGAEGLTVSQFGTLEALYHLGPMNQGVIAHKILKSSGNITMVVDNLEKRGLVRRVREAEDRRCVSVHLTEAGRELIHRIFPSHVRLVTDSMAALEPQEIEELGRLCRKLGRAQGSLERPSSEFV